MTGIVGIITVKSTGASIPVAIIGTGITVNTYTNGGPAFYYQHTQSVASATWTINHNLGSRPNVAVFTVGGVEVDCEVIHTSNNQAVALFDSTFSGYAICS